MAEYKIAVMPNMPASDVTAEPVRAKWERPTVIQASLRQAENGPISVPTTDGDGGGIAKIDS